MDSAAIIAEARRISGLEEPDSDSFREGLDILTGHLAVARELNDTGRQTIAGIAAAMLANRLRVADYARRHPEILRRAIEAPVIILGMPRTGTTMLSHLLSVDPDRRSLLRWEAFDSVPPATEATLKTDPRCVAMKETDRSGVTSASEIHLERADLPIECIVVLAHDFKSVLWAGMVESRQYTQWFLNCDMTSSYAYHKLQLQVLQSHTHGRWALKAPSHGLFIPTLRKTYPGARIVWIHRDPYKAMGSVCSLIAESRRAFGYVDETTIGPSSVELFKQHLLRPMAIQQQEGQGSMYNLHYAALVRDPIGEMRRLYRWLGDEFTERVEGNMHAWLREYPQGKFGRHYYDLERFGLSVEELRPHFQDYVDQYGVAQEL
jgi:hypothetical protein